MPDSPVTSSHFNIYKENKELMATVTHHSGSEKTSLPESVIVTDFKVKKGLSLDTDPYTEELNTAEGLVLHALTMTKSEEMEGAFTISSSLRQEWV